MRNRDLTLIEMLANGYEHAKKPIAYIVMFLAALVHTLPSDFLPVAVQEVTYMAIIVVLAFILMQVLFAIHHKVVESNTELNIIASNELYDSIQDIVMNERKVSIKYIGVAGRHGWTSVLAKLLDDRHPDSLIQNRTQFSIELALLNPAARENNEELYRRFDAVNSIAADVESFSQNIPQVAQSGSQMRLYFYDHMPNMLGFLINENYLFVTHAYWEHLQGKMTLRAGGTDYFVYDKNDEFGGQEVIRRFSGWFDFISESNVATVDTLQKSG